jgi:ArsR family transcriptional regulator
MECCPPVFGRDLAESDAEELASALKAVADPARLRLLNLIASAGEACACDLEEPLGLSQPTISYHLKTLTEAGFLEREQRGRWAYYRVIPRFTRDLASALTAGVPA